MKSQGFTLIEVIVAVFLVAVVLVGALALVNQIIVFTQITSSRLVAVYLGQEGIEIVRNIRDTNFLKIHRRVTGINWDTGLTDCTAGCEAAYNNLSLVSANRYLRIGGGFYNYDSGPETTFKRRIIVTPDGANILRVSVEVSWRERDRTHQVVVHENLHRWWR